MKAYLVCDLEFRGHPTSFVALMIGALGHYSPKLISLFHHLLHIYKIANSDFKLLLDKLAKLVIAAFYKIFLSI